MDNSYPSFPLLKKYLASSNASYDELTEALKETLIVSRRPFDGSGLWKEIRALLDSPPVEGFPAPTLKLLSNLMDYLNYRGSRDSHLQTRANALNDSVRDILFHYLTEKLNYSEEEAKTFLFLNPPPRILLKRF